jgi:hypothetical protein
MMFKKKSFRKYLAIGLFVLVVTTVVRTALLYVGREVMGISLLILSPYISLMMFLMGFMLKYVCYDRWDMLKDD